MDSLTVTFPRAAAPLAERHQKWLARLPDHLRPAAEKLLAERLGKPIDKRDRASNGPTILTYKWCRCCHSSRPSDISPDVIKVDSDTSRSEIDSLVDELDGCDYGIECSVKVRNPPPAFTHCIDAFCRNPSEHELAHYLYMHPDFGRIPESFFKKRLARYGKRGRNKDRVYVYYRFDIAFAAWRMSRERPFRVLALNNAARDPSTFLSKLPKDILGLVAELL